MDGEVRDEPRVLQEAHKQWCGIRRVSKEWPLMRPRPYNREGEHREGARGAAVQRAGIGARMLHRQLISFRLRRATMASVGQA